MFNSKYERIYEQVKNMNIPLVKKLEELRAVSKDYKACEKKVYSDKLSNTDYRATVNKFRFLELKRNELGKEIEKLIKPKKQ